jgi:putative DNA primase/helicase
MDLKKMIFKIATATSAKSVTWKNRNFTWDELVQRFTSAKVTEETYKEFISASKAEQGNIKDVGAFIGGELFGSRRNKNNVGERTLMALDIDFGEVDFPDRFFATMGCACIIHGTHKHNPKAGVLRYRVIIPLSEPVDSEQYEALSRKVAELTGIDLYDRTTFQTERCMFWPSVSKDVDFDFTDYSQVCDEPLDVQKYLGYYDNWRDTTEWAYHRDEKGEVRSLAKQQQDPTLKDGVVGDFCRAYSISEAISMYLSDVYEPTEKPDRWTFTGGTTSGGMLTFDDMFAYSFHNNDPIQGNHVFNAFDLVRVHLYGKMEKKASMEAMSELVNKDVKVAAGRAQRLAVKAMDTVNDFEDIIEAEVVEQNLPDTSYENAMSELETDKRGNYLPSAKNLSLIMRYDPKLQGLIARDLFKERRVVTRVPAWRPKDSTSDFQDVDFAGVRKHIEDVYGITGSAKIDDAIALAAENNSFHPVQDYLTGLTWDGVKRVDTALIDIMGAEDTIYTREAFRIMLIGAVKRIFQKGCKFDSMLVLQSDQGAGKSTFLKKLGRGWFSDSLSNMDGKGAFEQLQGHWIIEVAELSAMRKSEVEMVKNFITKTEDSFRPAYGRVTKNFPRQCVFFGTTNKDEFLKDSTGGRRFLPVRCKVNENTPKIFAKDFEEYVDQLWAEAVQMYYSKTSTLLSPEAEALAEQYREEHYESDPRSCAVQKYAEMYVPFDWEKLNSLERKMYFANYDESEVDKSKCMLIDFLSVPAVLIEALDIEVGKIKRTDAADAAAILSKLSGWERSVRRNKAYGQQRGYARIVNEPLENND